MCPAPIRFGNEQAEVARLAESAIKKKKGGKAFKVWSPPHTASRKLSQQDCNLNTPAKRTAAILAAAGLAQNQSTHPREVRDKSLETICKESAGPVSPVYGYHISNDDSILESAHKALDLLNEKGRH